eukprot:33893-Alexandrium_andersonii.AAC.1
MGVRRNRGLAAAEPWPACDHRGALPRSPRQPCEGSGQFAGALGAVLTIPREFTRTSPRSPEDPEIPGALGSCGELRRAVENSLN